MKFVQQIFGIPGTSTSVTLPLQTGTTEILNDTNYTLSLTLNTGQILQLPGVAQLYPTPPQGSTINIAIQATPLANMNSNTNGLLSDQGPSNFVTINQYLPGEANTTGYPFMLARSVAVQSNPYQFNVSSVQTNLASGVTFHVNSIVFQTFVYLQGFDIDIDQESTQHQVTMNITGLQSFFGTFTLNYLWRTLTNGAVHDRVRYTGFGLPSLLPFTGANQLTVTIPAVSGSTSAARINVFSTCM